MEGIALLCLILLPFLVVGFIGWCEDERDRLKDRGEL